MLQMLQRHIAGKDHRIHREGFWPEVGIKEMDGKDKSNGQQRFITMDDLGNVDQPAGEKLGEENRGTIVPVH